MWLALPPAGIVPVLNAPVFDVAVCAVLSPFTQVTVVPTDTVIGLGEYAVVERVCAPLTMVMVEPAGDGVVGVVPLLVLVLLLPQPAIRIAARMLMLKRNDMFE